MLTSPEVAAMDRAAAELEKTSQDAVVLTLCAHIQRLAADYHRRQTAAPPRWDDQVTGG